MYWSNDFMTTTSQHIDPNLLKVLDHVLRFPEKKINRVVELWNMYRFATDAVTQQEILSILAELLTQGVAFKASSAPAALDDTVDVEAARKVLAYRQQVGSRIRTCRLKRGLTQDQLSEKAGLPQSHVCRLEKGRHAATTETIRRIASALEVEMGELDPAYE